MDRTILVIAIFGIVFLCVSSAQDALTTTILLDDFSSETGVVFEIEENPKFFCDIGDCYQTIDKWVNQQVQNVEGDLRLTAFHVQVSARDKANGVYSSSPSGKVEIKDNIYQTTFAITNTGTVDWNLLSLDATVSYISYPFCRVYEKGDSSYPPDCDKYPMSSDDFTRNSGNSVAFSYSAESSFLSKPNILITIASNNGGTVGRELIYNQTYYNEEEGEYVVPFIFTEDDSDFVDMRNVTYISIGVTTQNLYEPLNIGKTASFSYNISNIRIVHDPNAVILPPPGKSPSPTRRPGNQGSSFSNSITTLTISGLSSDFSSFSSHSSHSSNSSDSSIIISSLFFLLISFLFM